MWNRCVFAAFAATLGLGLATASADRGGIPNNAATLHVYVHYDYLVEADGTSHAPPPESIEMVRKAFAAQGIELHIDPHHTAIPAWKIVLFERPPGDCVDPSEMITFERLKAQYFHPTSNHPWKYAIFGIRLDCFYNSGIAEINGDDFYIALGQFREAYEPLPAELRIRAWATVFMHELGHTLGLLHGGREDLNFKPNYLSVMNYAFAFGIPFAPTLGSVDLAGFRIDYSGRALPALDERDLDENVGIQAGTTDITIFDHEFAFGSGAGAGPIDWNLNGDATERHLASNVNGLEDSFLTRLTGFDDWSYVKGVLRGTIPRGPRSISVHDRAHQPQVFGVDPRNGTGIGGNEVRIIGAHLGKVDAVFFGTVQAPSFRAENDKTLLAIAPPGAGTVHVNVLSADNPSPIVAADLYTYLRPVLREVNPPSGPYGTLLTVSGERLGTTTSVRFQFSSQIVQAPSWEVVDDRTIKVATPGSCFVVSCADHPVLIMVDTTDFGANEPFENYRQFRAWGNLFTFLLSPQPGPVVTSVTPSTGPAGTAITIRGSGFRYMLNGTTQNAVGIFLGEVPLNNVAILSADTISGEVPPASGTVDVRVFSAIGRSPLAPEARFTYPAP